MYSYFESRGGRYGTTVFFGLQYLLREYLSGVVVTMEDVAEAERFFAAHGEPFNTPAWAHLVERHGGRLPIRIRAVAEGCVVPTHNILMSAESTDPELFWIVSWLETILVRLWYPITVATQSFYIKKDILDALTTSADDPLTELPFKLHDFGSRGVSSRESAGIGGMSHLVNFQGSDTVEGVRFANHYYDHAMAGFSIPAAEHSTITMWGRARELEAYRNMVAQFAKPGKTVACVSDSFDIYNVVESFWGDDLRDDVRDSGGTLVIRPDSGSPVEVILKCLEILERKVGMSKNTKGFKVLPKYYRIIQGDGVDPESIRSILFALHAHGYSATNLGFGMGGANLQKLNRDTQKFAFKCSEATVGGESVKVFKDPATDNGKRSKAGRLSLVQDGGRLRTVEGGRKDDVLVPVFEDGKILVQHTFEEVRANTMRGLL
jgi:nicotinamide phosphoribosyltransferase